MKSLNRREKRRLVNALNRLVRDGRYVKMANVHGAGAPRAMCPNMPYGFCCPHNSIQFLPWHRLYMAQIEEELGEPLPYWDWTEDPEIPDLWERTRAPSWRWWQTNRRCGRGSPFLIRRQNFRIPIKEELKKKTKFALGTARTFEEFNELISLPHNRVHNEAGCDIQSPTTAAYDPIFYLHHAYVDYQWAFFQELQKIRGINESPPRELNQENAPFNRGERRNGFKNNNQRTLQNNRGRDTLEYKKNFCYEYDQLTFDGMTPAEFIEHHSYRSAPVFRSSGLRDGKCGKVCQMQTFGETYCDDVCVDGKHPGSFLKVYVGVVMPRIAPSGISTFDLCQGGKCVEGGKVATFGSTSVPVENHKSQIDDKNFQLMKTQVTHIVDEQGWTLKKPLVAKMTSTMVENLPQPVVSLKELVKGGIAVKRKVTLSPKEKRRHYGNLL